MATKLIFTDETTEGKMVSDELQVYANDNNRLFISMSNPNDDYRNCFITISKEDAKLLSKLILNQIKLM